MSKSEVKEVFKGCGAHAEQVGQVHQGNMLLLVEYWLTLESTLTLPIWTNLAKILRTGWCFFLELISTSDQVDLVLDKIWSHEPNPNPPSISFFISSSHQILTWSG